MMKGRSLKNKWWCEHIPWSSNLKQPRTLSFGPDHKKRLRKRMFI